MDMLLSFAVWSWPLQPTTWTKLGIYPLLETAAAAQKNFSSTARYNLTLYAL